MNAKFLICATLAYTVLTFAVAIPWHFIFFVDLYHRLGIYNREPPIMALGLLSIVVQGLILAYLYPGFGKHGKPLLDGIRFGLLMGLFLFSVSTLANAAKIQVNSIIDFIGVQVAFHGIQFAVAGAAIGLLYNKLKSNND